MTYQNLLLGIALHLLFYEHLPHWGTWFMKIIKALPKPLQTLYEQWRCPYCCGFWIGLALHGLTGDWLFPIFAEFASHIGVAGAVLAWFSDALVFALLTKLGVILVNALTYPALLAMVKKQEWMAAEAAKKAE